MARMRSRPLLLSAGVLLAHRCAGLTVDIAPGQRDCFVLEVDEGVTEERHRLRRVCEHSRHLLVRQLARGHVLPPQMPPAMAPKTETDTSAA